MYYIQKTKWGKKRYWVWKYLDYKIGNSRPRYVVRTYETLGEAGKYLIRVNKKLNTKYSELDRAIKQKQEKIDELSDDIISLKDMKRKKNHLKTT